MAVPPALVRLLEPWAELYGNSSVLSTVVVFGHIAALVFAGGLAVTLDRGTLRAARGSPDLRQRQLDELAAAHRLVIGGIALSAATGVLLLTADIETYFASWIYWTKMGLIVALLVNGFAMTRSEAGLRVEGPHEHGWTSLRTSAAISIALWFAIAFAGVALVNS